MAPSSAGTGTGPAPTPGPGPRLRRSATAGLRPARALEQLDRRAVRIERVQRPPAPVRTRGEPHRAARPERDPGAAQPARQLVQVVDHDADVGPARLVLA